MSGREVGISKSSRKLSSADQLDDAFHNMVSNMKPFVLKLDRKSERERMALWIKKLCENPGSSLNSRENRNMYAEVLLSMLKRNIIDEPFCLRPESGPLPTLPKSMSVYMDESSRLSSSSSWYENENENSITPSWIKRELNVSSGMKRDDSILSYEPSKRHSSTKRTLTESYLNDENSISCSRNFTTMEEELSPSPYKTKLNTRGTMRYEPIYLREILNGDLSQSVSTPMNSNDEKKNNYSSILRSRSITEDDDSILQRVTMDKQMQARNKLMEARFHEEKLRLQQQHDLSVQKILDRKNNELEEMKAKYRNKLTETESRLKKQDRKIVTQAREMERLREQRDKTVCELKNCEQDRGINAVNDSEKKLHDKISEFEQEKFEMQKEHTREIQDILEETNARIAKMEDENKREMEGLNEVVKKLEQEIERLRIECETLRSGTRNIEYEKSECEKQLKTLQAEYDHLKENVASSERRIENMTRDHETKIKELEKKTRDEVDREKKEKEIVLTQTSTTINKLKTDVLELERQIAVKEQERHNDVEEIARVHLHEKVEMQHNFENKERHLEQVLNEVRDENDKRIFQLEASLRDKNDELERAVASHRDKDEEAQKALAEFKIQMEETSRKMFEDAKLQMDKVEQDLERSRSSREKQAKEYTRQIESERMRHEKLVSELKITHEQEKAIMIREHEHENEMLNREHEREKAVNNEENDVFWEMESKYRNKSTIDANSINELQQVNVSLREELMKKEGLYKQQLVELGMLRDEEKQTFERKLETQATKSQTEMEQERLEWQRQQNSKQMEEILDKTNSRLKQMEEDYIARSKKMQEVHLLSLQNSHEERFNITARKHEEDKEMLKNHHSVVIKSLENDIERLKNLTRETEKEARKTEIDLQEKISKLQYEYEEKMNNLLPRQMKNELEDTIRSLRQQVSILQSRADILQEELDSTNTLSSTWDLSHLDKPLKN
ncbi:centrosomal protein of 112 kDa-like [Xenia sp. Carnegie-2017]|uniref:centrosomal protein of 112 kDa-like n=1 Tax=Xenia sp. Carnegie-2017 TaxID=2897299 RepID=UPI001F044ECC|nr:centrosomal protein of 112 kDa-like [Xenia sp. Carnegie-2017]